MCYIPADSQQFAAFVDDELDGDRSEVDELTDDDDLDADPTFTLASTVGNNENAVEDTSSSEDEPESIPVDQAATGMNVTVCSTTRTAPTSNTRNLDVTEASRQITGSRRSTTTFFDVPSTSVAIPSTIITESTTNTRNLGVPTPRMQRVGSSGSASVATPSTTITTSSTNTSSRNDPTAPRERVFWKKINTFDPLPPAPDHEPLALNAMNFAPNTYVNKYIPENIFALLTEHTNRRHLEEKGKELGITEEKMRKFFGATIMMSLMGYPRIRMYWEAATKVPFVASLISRDLYFTIRKHLKIVTDTEVPEVEKSTNKFWKVSPLVKSVRTGCLLNPKPKTVAVDEQMIPFWGHAPARQVIKTKPNPCGLKNFVVAAPNGLPLDFFFYQGKGDAIVNDLEFQQLDVGGKAVMKLLNTFPSGISVYLDRFFTSELLLDLLFSHREATGTGTLTKNKVPKQVKLKLTDDSLLKKQGRGSVDQCVRSDGQIAVIKWYDSKPVRLISNKEGVLPMDKCRRWCKVQKLYIEVDRPFVVKAYNTEMGGVDFLDRMISYYRIGARTKKWTVRVIMHFLIFLWQLAGLNTGRTK